MSLFGQSADAAAVRKAAGDVNGVGKDIEAILVPEDRPRWLSPITSATGTFARNEMQGAEFITQMLLYYHQVGTIELSATSKHYDFDALYARLRDEHRLPELFDDLVKTIKEILDSGQIDSAAAIQALTELMEVLKANRTGSFVSVRQSISFGNYVKNVVIVALKKVTAIGILLEAYDRSFDEASAELDRLATDLNEQSMNAMRARIPNVERLSAIIDPPRLEQTPAPALPADL
jgi:hypothetical protein